MRKDPTTLSLIDVLIELHDNTEDDPLLSGSVSVNSITYGVRHFSYNGIKNVEGDLVPAHRYTILINYSKVFETSLDEMRRYDVDIRETVKGLTAKAKVIRPTQVSKKAIAA